MDPAAPVSKRKATVANELCELQSPIKRRRSVTAHSRSSTPPASPERRRIPRCSSNASLLESEEEQLRSHSTKSAEELEASWCSFPSNRERESSPSVMELTATADKHSTPEPSIPPATEIEEFFAAAEMVQKRRFTDKYNYDVHNDFPLDGRYLWVPFEA